ncbi:MAG: hypothetical protein J0L57_04655 [Burkholderiales bacterium]|nr:hypothetical protein [Burkholderiales bacterium]
MNDLLAARRKTGTPDPADAYARTELLSPATQLVADKDAYLGNAPTDIGRRVADDQFELFVVCQPAEAMLQQFAQLTPDFIAIHDIGTGVSARLIAALAAASQRKLQRLVIRRQGYGVALATIEFVELPLAAGKLLRVYSTQVDADMQTRQQLAQVLLAHSRLGVMIVGDLPAHALDSQLQPLRRAITSGPWPNRQLLLVPLGNAPSLPAQAAALTGNTPVVVSTTPQVVRPADAWNFVSGAWNRIHGSPDGAASARPVPRPEAPAAAPTPAATPLRHEPAPVAPFDAPTQPAALTPMPVPRAAAAAQPQSPHQSAVWAEYVQRCAAIKGLQQACVFDLELQRPLAYDGAQRSAERLAAKGAMLHAVLCDSADALGLGTAPPDAVVTLAEHYLLLRPMPGRPQVALHLLIDRNQGNLGLVRAELHRIDQALLAPNA